MARFRSVPHSLSRHRDQSIESARRLFLLPPAGQPLQHCGFPGINTCLKHMRDKKIMPGPNNKCLQTKPEDRQSAEQLLSHPFLQKRTDLKSLGPLIRAAKKRLNKRIIE